MKKTLILLVSLFCFAGKSSAQGTQVVTLPSDPATCSVGMTYYNSTTNTLKSCGPANTWSAAGSTSPSSLTTFFPKFMGRSPNDYGAFGDVKFCYDLNVSGQPIAIITSGATKTLTNSALTNNVATYTFTNTNSTTIPLIAPGQTVSVTGSNNANGALNVTSGVGTDGQVVSATATAITVKFTHANVASAADTGTITTLAGSNVGCMNFNSARDVGKVIEIKGVGAAGAILSTTILSVQSATQATLAANATTNANLQKAWSGHDDTTALQSWVTDINNGIPVDSPLSGGTILNHSGYVPGLYFTTKPLRFVNPLGNQGFCGNCGFGTPEPFTLANAGESLSLWGSGVYRSGFVTLSTYNFTLNPSLNDAPLYMLNWNGSQIMNIAVLSPDRSIVYSTAGNTGVNCGWISDASAHNTFIGFQVENFANGGTLPGFCTINTDYGGNYENFQFYGNDYNLYLKAGPTAASNLMTDINFRGGQLLSPGGTAASGGNVIFDATASPVPFSNVNFSGNSFSNNCDGNVISNGISEITFRSGVTVSDIVNINGGRICDASSANGFGVAVLTGAVSGEVDLNGVWLGQPAATSNAAFSPFFIQPTNWAIKMFGGSLNKGATNLTNLGTVPTSSRIFINGTANNTGATAFAGTGATTGVWTCFESAANCSGPGTLRNTITVSDQGTAQTNGNIALSANWGTGPTVTLSSGFAQNHRFTVTTGTTPGANPTITDTLPNALPTANTICTARVEGGTGTITSITQTTPSATAPVFTFNGTPGAAGTTYVIDVQCGP